MQDNARNSPFLRLPAELRNKIYALVLGAWRFELSNQRNKFLAGSIHHPALFVVSRHRNFPAFNPSPRSAKILTPFMLVSRQVYVETAMLPFSTYTFKARDYHDELEK